MNDIELAERKAHELSKSAKKGGVKSLIEGDAFKRAVEQVLPRHLSADRFVRIAIAAMTRTPKLRQCTGASVLKCLMDLSFFGLEPDGRLAHLIPYKDQCTLIVDYKGMLELAYRTGKVSRIHADKICENDEFSYNKGDIERHHIDFRRPRGEVYAYYCEITFKDGTHKAEVMTIDDVNAIRDRSRSKNNGPWVTDFDEMAKKTVARRLFKWVQLSPEIVDILDREQEFESMKRADITESAPLFDDADDAGGEDGAAESEHIPFEIESPTAKEVEKTKKATDHEGIKNLLTSAGIEEQELMEYIEKEGQGSFKLIEDVPPQICRALIHGFHGVAKSIMEGRK